MEERISEYLFTRKACPLPSLGLLQVVEGNASVSVADKGISAPVPFIVFSPSDNDAGDLVDFIASTGNISRNTANEELFNFSQSVLKMEPGSETVIPCAGRFYMDADGKLAFKQDVSIFHFLPFLPAERIIRQDAVHQVKVGDRETTSAAMSEFFSERAGVKTQKWWIAALIFFLIGIVAVIYYFSTPGYKGSFGNTTKTEKVIPPTTYKTSR